MYSSLCSFWNFSFLPYYTTFFSFLLYYTGVQENSIYQNILSLACLLPITV